MSWARLAAELDAATKWVERTAPRLRDAGGAPLVTKANAAVGAFVTLQVALQQEDAVPPSGREAALLSGALARARERLQVLHTLDLVLAPDAHAIEAPMFGLRAMLLQRSCDLLGSCAGLAATCQLPASEAQQLANVAAQLVLGPGARMLQTAEQHGSRVLNDDSSYARGLATVEGQSEALEAQMTLCKRHGAACLASLASAGMPPSQFAAWLSSAAALLLLYQRRPGGAAGVAGSAAHLTRLLAPVFYQPASFGPHMAAVQQDQQLCSRLLDLLLPALSAAAVALQLPEERRGGHSWIRVASLVSVLRASALRPALGSRLAAREQAARAALQAAASLALQAPQASLEGQRALELCGCLAELLGLALENLPSEHWGQRVAMQVETALQGLRAGLQLATAAPADARATTAAVAAPAEPTAATEARAAEPAGAAGAGAAEPAVAAGAAQPVGSLQPSPATLVAAADLCSDWAALLEGLSDTLLADAGAISGVGGAAGLQAWLGAAAMALQALPPLARLLQHSVAEAGAWSSTASWLCASAAAIATMPEPSQLATALPAGLGRTHGSRESCRAALWQLHSLACRAVHWAVGGGVPGQLMGTTQCNALVVTLNNSLEGYSSLLSSWAPDMALSADDPMRAMFLAHTAALHALAGSGLQLLPGRVLVSATLVDLAVASTSVPALPLQPAFGGALAWALQALLAMPPDSIAERLSASIKLLHHASCSAQLAAVLAADGTLARLARELANGAAGPRPILLEQQVTAAVRRLTKCIMRLVHVPAIQHTAELVAVAEASMQAHVVQPGLAGAAALAALAQHALPPARELAAALLEWWRRPEQAAADALELAQAAALRSCAYLRCANLAGEGGPAAGQGAGSLKCSACRAVWYCGTACSHADWREPGGHRRVCRALEAARKAARQQQAAGEGAAS